MFVFSFVCHLVADFLMQGCLANMKQISWWEDQIKAVPKEQRHKFVKDGPVTYVDEIELKDTRYKNDWYPCLLAHGFIWAAVMMVPYMFIKPFDPGAICIGIVLNALFHAWVDHQKCNKYRISLYTDQLLHLLQVLATSILWYLCIEL